MTLRERLGSAVVAAVLVAGARAGLIALTDKYLAVGLTGVGVSAIVRDFAAGVPWTLLAAVLLAIAAGRSRVLTTALALAGAALGFLFIAGRLPALPIHAPGFGSTPERIAHALAALIALTAATIATVGARPRRIGPPLSILSILVLVVATGAALLPRERSAPVRTRPNIILLSIDTLRADRVGCYGYDRGTTPALDAFAGGGVRFERAYAPQPWTLTSHMTMLTGLYPSVHGLDRDTRLSQGVTTLAQRFQRAGYVTAGVLDKVAWLDTKYGFGRGFHLFRRLGGDATLKVAAADVLLEDLADEPFFLFMHVFDVHSDWEKLPYEAEPEDREEFAGWYDGTFDGCEDDLCASKFLQRLVAEGRSLEGDEARYVSSLYDAGLRSLDRRLQPFLERLEASGRLDDTVVFITSDHGEELFEHGSCLHGQYHDEVMRVPMIVRGPGVRAGAVSGGVVEHVDLAPTFAALAGLDASDFQGTSFAPALAGPDFEGDGHALLDATRDHYFVATSDWKLFLTGNPQLFDLRTDPHEQTDLLADEPGPEIAAVVERLRALARTVAEAGPKLREKLGAAVRGVTLSESEQRALEEIGYVGGE